jgi:hypothetical protein
VTFWALAEMVKGHAGILETDGADQAAAKLAGAVAEAIAVPADAEWVEQHLRPLVGLSAEVELGGERRSEAFAAWRRFLEALAERRPLVLVFEDLQWADDDLLAFVDYLVEWATGVPLLVLCTARPELLERRPGWGGGKRNASTLSLSPLSDEETARLIGLLGDRPFLLAETQMALLARAGGNPLYAEHYVRMLAERGPEEELPLPETVQGIIAARLDGLSSDEKSLLQDAAVVGKVFWMGALRTIGGVERWTAEERLHALERKDFVHRARRASVADETEYAFRHLLVRDVAYGQIPRAARAQKHRLAAEWIESLGRPEDHAEMLAHHYASALELAHASGQDTASLADPARFALRDAGDRALTLHASATAAHHYRAALDLWPQDDPGRPDLLFRYGAAAYDIDALSEARNGLLERGEREAAAEAEVEISLLHWYRGERDPSAKHLLQAAELLADAPPSRAHARMLHQVARQHMLAAENESAIEVGRDALRMAETLGLDDIRVDALTTVGSARLHLGDEAGLVDLKQSIALATETNSPGAVRAYTNLGAMLFNTGELAPAYEMQEHGRREARRFGLLLQLRFLEDHQAEEFYWTGRWDEAKELASRRIAEADKGSPDYLASGFRCYRALIQLGRGNVEEALADARAALPGARVVRDPQQLELALAQCAQVLLAIGDREGAGALVDEALTGWLGVRAQSFDLCWVVGQLGRTEPFLEALEHHAFRSLWKEAARAVVHGDFARAADLYAEIGSKPDEAHARLRAAHQGQHEQLGPAIAFYRSVGANRYVREGEALLAASA